MNTIHFSTPGAEVPAYAQLQRQIHDALLQQNPDWILPNGECPRCASYEARFAELLLRLPRSPVREPKQHSIDKAQFALQYA